MHEENPVIIELPTEGDLADVGISFSRETSVVPLTVGAKQRAAEDSEVSLHRGIKQARNRRHKYLSMRTKLFVGCPYSLVSCMKFHETS